MVISLSFIKTSLTSSFFSPSILARNTCNKCVRCNEHLKFMYLNSRLKQFHWEWFAVIIARIFQRGGHTVSKWGYSADCHVDLHAMFLIKKKDSKKGPLSYGQDIVMVISPPVVGCLVKKGLQKGGSRAPQDPPGFTLGYKESYLDSKTHNSKDHSYWNRQ